MPVGKQQKRRAIEIADDLAAAKAQLRQAELAVNFGRRAKRGYHFVRNIIGGAIVEEADGTPFTCSVASETYHCS